MTERAAGRKNTTQFVFAENSLDILRLFAALQIAITHYLNLTMLTYGKDGPGDGLLLGFKRALTLFPGLIILFSISGFLMGETLMRTQKPKNICPKTDPAVVSGAMGQHCADDGDALFASRRRFGAWERSADLGSCAGRRSGLYAVLFCRRLR